MSKELKTRIGNAFRAMKEIGIEADKVKPALRDLYKLNNKNWAPIEEENYRALVDAIKRKEEEEGLEKNVDNEAQDHSFEEDAEAEESEPPLKRVKQEYPDRQTLALTESHASNIEERRPADETNRGSKLASNEKKATNVVEAGVTPIISSTPLPMVPSSQVLLDSFPMLAREAAASEGHIAEALSHFTSGAYSLVCAGEKMKSNRTTIEKLQAEATTLRFELAEANKAKATVLEYVEDLKADREAIQATLGKTREELKSSHASIFKLQVEACTFNFEMAEANKAKALVAENLKKAQDNYQTLLEELEDVKADREAIRATLGKTREGLKCRHAIVSKLHGEATALRFEVAEANKAKAMVLEKLKTAQSNFLMLCGEFEGAKAERDAIRATLAQTREGLKPSHATISKLQAEASTFRFEVAKANNAKTIIADNLKTALNNFSTLLDELKDIKADRDAVLATLGKTRAQLANLQEESESEIVKLRSELDAAKKGQTQGSNEVIQTKVGGLRILAQQDEGVEAPSGSEPTEEG